MKTRHPNDPGFGQSSTRIRILLNGLAYYYGIPEATDFVNAFIREIQFSVRAATNQTTIEIYVRAETIISLMNKQLKLLIRSYFNAIVTGKIFVRSHSKISFIIHREKFSCSNTRSNVFTCDYNKTYDCRCKTKICYLHIYRLVYSKTRTKFKTKYRVLRSKFL